MSDDPIDSCSTCFVSKCPVSLHYESKIGCTVNGNSHWHVFGQSDGDRHRNEDKSCQNVFMRAVMLHRRQHSEVQWTSTQFLLIQWNLFKSPSLEQFQQIQCHVHHLSDYPLFFYD